MPTNELISSAPNMDSLLQYIESNISLDLDTELLSNVGYASRPKLYRDFYNLTGHSIKEYIRKRRLSNALALIKTSEMGITEIAFQCGYSSHQALCRAIKRALNLTPTEYKNESIYYFFPPFNNEPLQSVTVANDMIPHTLQILYYSPILSGIEDMAVNTFLQVFPNYEGRIFGKNGKQNRNRFCYELYLSETDRDYSILEHHGFEISQIVPYLNTIFAKSTIQNDEQKINAAWDYLYSEWLQYSMFKYTNDPYYEEYILKNGKAEKLKLYLPIRRRSGETKITLTDNPELCFITAKAEGYNAEKTASQAVINYITNYYPHIVQTLKNLYVNKGEDSYTCGVQVDSNFQFIENNTIRRTTTEQRKYLVLHSSVMGDYDRYVDILSVFAYNNGMVADMDGIFVVYNTSKGIKNLSVKMYCPLIFVTK